MTLPPPKLAGGPYLMGVLNVTPDSFSDGGRWQGVDGVAHALAMLEAGADVIDIGGESTRPGATPVSVDEECARVLGVILGLRAATDAPISIDTSKPAVAIEAVRAGATMWNDVTGLGTDGALAAAASLRVPVIVMHMRGEPRTMQTDPHYVDVVAEVIAFLADRVGAARRANVAEVWVDPGIGFGKTVTHNLALLQAIGRIRDETGRPVLVGASRKSFIAKLDPAPSAAIDRLGGSIATALLAAQAGAAMLRVHDVAETVQALRLWRALETPV